MSSIASTPAPSKKRKAVSKPAISEDAAFDEAYRLLNPDQKRAVDTIEGPVMVVAGPGTGKTQTLALRVANILKTTHAKPGNILCLTFSKSGAVSMRERLRTIIGSDAYGVTVNTIHGFCNDVIVQHPSVFEDWSSLHQISDVERYREINRIIDELLPDLAVVNPKSPYGRTKEIIGRISQLKKEGVKDHDELVTIADRYAEDLSGKSREGTKAHAQNVLKGRKFREFLEIYFRYQKMLETTSRYDYEDMILNVIRALETEDWLLSGLQERYQYLLVDEFQDTNGAQYRLIELLSTDRTGDNRPNLFVVGDDDQAIYRFQGANLKNILSFHDRFPDAPVIPLVTSYRCTQLILDAASSLIRENTERLVGRIKGLRKDLKAASGEKGEQPRLLFAASDMAEPWMIADLVDERLRKGIAPDEIAVLVWTNAELVAFYEVFKAREIPVKLSGKLDLLHHPLVGQVVAILKAIQNPRSDANLASAMSCPCFELHPADLGRLFRACRDPDERKRLMDILLDFDALTETEKFADPKSIKRVRDILLTLHERMHQRTVLETLERLYRECGLLSSFKKGELDIIDFAAAQEFFDRIRQRALENPHFTFPAFLDDLEYYGNPEYGELRMSYDLPHLTREGVQLMTAHKSKGLEFHTVILANFSEGRWDKRRNPSPLSVPEDLLFGWEKEQKSFEQNQDERRVAYVAMTRAKRELIFTCPRERTSGDSNASVSPSGFFAEAGKLFEEDREVRDPASMSTLLAVPQRALDKEFEAFLREKIESFSLSATSLHDFIEDPSLFVERHLLEKPQPKESFFAYGNAVHHALARFAKDLQDGKALSEAGFLRDFRNHLDAKEILTDTERKRLAHVGESSLPRYFAERLQPPYPIVDKVEFSIHTRLHDIPIKGKIDRIDLLEPHSSSACIRDFKTGRPKTEKECIDMGYVDQLTFYAILIENGYGMIDPKEFVLDFIGEGENAPIERKFAIGSAEKKELSKLVEQVWAKILALDFTAL